MERHLERFWVNKENAALLVIDMQQKLIPSMPKKVYEKTLATIDLLVKSAREMNLPVVTTEQYPKGLGVTIPELADACREGVIEKLSFGCCGEPSFLEHLKALGKRQLIITGMEAHVCVYQTVLGLLQEGFEVHLVRDGIISRGKVDYQNALELAARAGATVTTAETVVFQLMRLSTAPEFRAVSKLVKNRG